ncbi:MAG TPA: STT3 domain-containing protein [Thermoanaerobaculia bacterium]
MNVASPAFFARHRAFFVAGAVFLGAFLIRTANLRTAFVGGVPQLSPFDELYHAKRIVYSADRPLRVLNFDPSRGTAGAFCPWPPLYDMTAGALARLLGGTDPTGVVARASWLPPLVSSLAAALVAAWLARRFGPATGLLAGAGIALATDYVDRSRLAAIDHHFLEFPLVLGIVAAAAAATDSRSSRDAARGAALLALALAAALLTQTALLLAAALVLALVLVGREMPPRSRLAAAGGFLLAAAIVAFYRVAQPAGYPDNEWYLGLPHASALLAAAAACAVQYGLLARGAAFWTSAGLAVAVGLSVLAAIPHAPEALLAGSRFLGGNAWLRSIVEFQPLFLGYEARFWPDLCLLGGGFLVTAAIAVTPGWRRGRRALLLAFALAYGIAAVSSRRFLAIATPLCAITAAVAVHDLRAWGRTRLARAAAAVVVVPSLLLTAGRVIRPAPVVTSDVFPLIRAAAFLGSRSASSPGAAVLGPWSWGHLFDVIGGQHVLLDNFGSVGGRTEFENATAITLATREKFVSDFCRERRVRFIVLEDPLPYFSAHAEMSGFPKAAFSTRDGAGPTRLMRATFWWRAYVEGGRIRPDLGPAGGRFRDFRLVLVESAPQKSEKRSTVQVWEFRPEGGAPVLTSEKKTIPIARDRYRREKE